VVSVLLGSPAPSSSYWLFFAFRSQEGTGKARGARRSLELGRGAGEARGARRARTSQVEPRQGGRRSQEESERARESQEDEPGGARRSQREP
jgi:hypothetical protein